jgi:L-threonylcarbamoyladenylate synthase
VKTLVCGCDAASIARAAGRIRSGGLVAFPTETVYGLGANGLDGRAVARIFEAKGRPGDNPLILHIARMEQLAQLTAGPAPECARVLAAAFWPGPLTIVLPKSAAVPDQVTAGLDTVGVRMPAHPAARALIEAAGVPIAAPSANRSGRPSPTTAAHVLEDMDGRIDMVLDGGACGIGLESTVVEVSAGGARVLRPGGVTAEMIKAALGAVSVDASALRPLAQGETARSPGMKYRHYAPVGRLSVVSGAPEAVWPEICRRYDQRAGTGARCAILARSEAPYGARRVRALGETPEAIASNLFAALREMDEAGAEYIFAEAVDTAGLGLAIMNRLGRAAAFDVIEV